MSFIITEKCNGCAVCVKFCPTAAISGEKKKLHKIDPDLCIDCGACGRVCPEEAILDEQKRVAKKMKKYDWPRPVVLKDCLACNICVETCPFACLDILMPGPEDDKHSSAYLKDEKSCVACGLCERNCPIEKIVMKAP